MLASSSSFFGGGVVLPATQRVGSSRCGCRWDLSEAHWDNVGFCLVIRQDSGSKHLGGVALQLQLQLQLRLQRRAAQRAAYLHVLLFDA